MMVEVYKSLHELNPPFMKEYFQLKHCAFTLRSTENLRLPPTRTVTFGMNSVHYQACSSWNKLPSEIKLASSLTTFKNSLSISLYLRRRADNMRSASEMEKLIVRNKMVERGR